MLNFVYQEDIDYFEPLNSFNTSQIKFTTFKMVTQNLMILGTKTGGIIGIQIDEKFNSKITIDLKEPLSYPIEAIDYIEDSFSLILKAKKNLYFFNVGQTKEKKALEIIRNIKCFKIQRTLKNYFLFIGINNKVMKYSLDNFVNKDKENKLEFITEYYLKSKVESFEILNNLLVVYHKDKKISLLDIHKMTQKIATVPADNDKIISILHDNDILVLLKFEKSKNAQSDSLGLFLDIEGNSVSHKNTLNVNSDDQIEKITCNDYFIIFSSTYSHYVYSARDNIYIHSFQIKNKSNDVVKNANIEFFKDDLYAIDENTIYCFKKLSQLEIIEKSKKMLNFKTGISLLKNLKNKDNEKKIDKKIEEINFYCGWALLDNNTPKDYENAIECLIEINFDPKEILEKIEPKLIIDNNYEPISTPDQHLKFLKGLFIKKRKILLKLIKEDEDYIINSEEILRKKNLHSDVQVKNWLSLIDYALLRAYIKLKEYKDLFNFLTKNEIYCSHKKSNLVDLTNKLEVIKNDKKIFRTILIEFNFLIEDFSKALKHLKFLILEKTKNNKRFDYEKYALEKTKDIFIKNQKKINIQKILKENFYWIILKEDYLLELFYNLDTNILPEIEFLRNFDDLQDSNKFKSKKKFLKLLLEKNLSNINLNNEYIITELNLLEENEEDYKEIFSNLYIFIKNPSTPINSLNVLKILRDKQLKIFEIKKDNELLQANFLNLETLLLKRIGTPKSHEEALNILFNKNEYAMAELYCSDITKYNTEIKYSKKTNYLLNDLLEHYVTNYNEDKSKNNLDRVNNLLKKYSGNPNLNSSLVTNILPQEFLVNDSDFDFFGFLDKTITELEAEHKRYQFKKQISEAELNNINYNLVGCQKRWVRIDDQTECMKCFEKIKNKLFNVFPNGVIVDCSCTAKFNTKNTCPVTYQNFEKTNFV